MATKRSRGRPTMLTPQVQEEIVSYIKNGNYPETAVRASGIQPRIYYYWMKRGREILEDNDDDITRIPAKHPDLPHAMFYLAIEKAKAESEIRNVLVIQKEAANTWTAAAWMLERRYPEKFGRRDQVNANVNANVNVSYAETLTEAWKKRQEKMNADGTPTD